MESKSKSLREILDEFAQIDDELAPDDFDPAQLIGDVKDKIDAIKWRIDKWEADAQAIKDHWIKPLTARAMSLQKKADKLSEYLHKQMTEHNFEKLPGHMFTATLRKNPPSLKLSLEPTSDLYFDYPELVVQLPIEYEFQKDKIKEQLKAGTELPFARLEQSTRIAFTAKKEDQNV